MPQRFPETWLLPVAAGQDTCLGAIEELASDTCTPTVRSQLRIE